MKKSFKDQCDICNKFDYLKAYYGKCLCSECIKKQNTADCQKQIKNEQKQLNLFDIDEKLSHFSHKNNVIMYSYNYE